MGKLIGIDFGSKRIGVSISDSQKKIAFSRGTLIRENNSFCIGKLKELLTGEEVEGFVVGLPLRTDRNDKNKSQLIREIESYTSKLKEVFQKPVHFLDERYTTNIAIKSTTSAGKSRKRREMIKKNIDSVSAQLILQTYLDKITRK